MNHSASLSAHSRRPRRIRLVKARVLATVTRLVAVLLVPLAFCREPGRARFLACQWALGLRFPREDLRGLAPETLTAFTHARAEAFWRHGQLIGLTSGYREAAEQHRIFIEEMRRTGSVSAARRRVLPPEESSHVQGLAIDVRPAGGARWLEQHGGRYGLYRVYDNEWWHFEYRTVEPVRLPHPDAAARLPEYGAEHGAAYNPLRVPARQHIAGISETAYVLATPPCLDWRHDLQRTGANSGPPHVVAGARVLLGRPGNGNHDLRVRAGRGRFVPGDGASLRRTASYHRGSSI